MDTQEGKNISEMIDRRLNDLLVENEESDELKKLSSTEKSFLTQADNENDKEEIIEPSTQYEGMGDLPLNELKSHLLSLDWEITDDTIKNILIQLERLKKRYKDDEYVLGLFKLMTVLTNYIKSKRAKSHPDSQKLLNSVYNAAETIFLKKDLTPKEKKAIVYKQVVLFREFKKIIRSSKHEGNAKKKNIGQSGPSSELVNMAPHEAFAYALNEIKEVINAEIKALRTELRLWREYEMQKDRH